MLFLTVVGGLATVVGGRVEISHGLGAGVDGCTKKTVACRREEEKLREGEDWPDLKLARREKTGDGVWQRNVFVEWDRNVCGTTVDLCPAPST